MEKKYQIDTEENKIFMKEIRENLLHFGHQFPAPDGTCYYLGDDGTPWKSKKYQIDTEENKIFMKEIRENLLHFGHQFPAPDGTCYYLGDDGTPWKSYNRETYATSRMIHVYTIGKYLGCKDRVLHGNHITEKLMQQAE